MRILDATCGMKGIWYQKNHPFVTFLDKRYINGKMQKTKNNISNRRVIRIQPDIVADWTKTLQFDNDHFDIVVFDPPHFIRNKRCDNFFYEKYDMLNPDTWKQDLKKGFKELFRVLKPEGVFIFKWNDCYRATKEVLKLCPYKPLFGTEIRRTSSNTHWMVFIKYRLEKELEVN